MAKKRLKRGKGFTVYLDEETGMTTTVFHSERQERGKWATRAVENKKAMANKKACRKFRGIEDAW